MLSPGDLRYLPQSVSVLRYVICMRRAAGALSLLYLEGQADLVSRLITRITGVTIWVIGVINLLTKSP